MFMHIASKPYLNKVHKSSLTMISDGPIKDEHIISLSVDNTKVKSGTRLQRIRSVAGYLKNRLYLDSRASVHIIFNQELMQDIKDIDQSLVISAEGKAIKMSQIALLHNALKHLPLPNDKYYYNQYAIANLLSFGKIAEEYHIICNIQVDDAIYVQSKDDGKYLRFAKDKKNILYFLDISEGLIDGHYYFSTMEKGKLQFLLLDQR